MNHEKSRRVDAWEHLVHLQRSPVHPHGGAAVDLDLRGCAQMTGSNPSDSTGLCWSSAVDCRPTHERPPSAEGIDFFRRRALLYHVLVFFSASLKAVR